MKSTDHVNWLLRHGGPVVRYLTACELISSPTFTEDQLKDGVMRSSAVRYWMECLAGFTDFGDMHGSRDTCFENALGKLTLFGIRSGTSEFDERCKPYLSLLEDSKNGFDIIQVFYRTITASLLAMAGYLVNACVRDWVMARLDAVFAFVKRGGYSIYADKAKFKGIPAAFRDCPVIDPDLYVKGKFALPWIYDMFAFRAQYVNTSDKSVKNKIETVVSYIMHPGYQRLYEGYGVVCTGENRYNVMGWHVWLPGYNGMHTGNFKMGCLVQRLELMSVFPNVLSSHWFMNNLNLLEGYMTDRGTYRFPKQYIKEKKNSYFMTGAHMGLGENRRQRLALDIESTFWMLKIRRNMARKDKGK
jgi:hypothetical protein